MLRELAVFIPICARGRVAIPATNSSSAAPPAKDGYRNRDDHKG